MDCSASNCTGDCHWKRHRKKWLLLVILFQAVGVGLLAVALYKAFKIAGT